MKSSGALLSAVFATLLLSMNLLNATPSAEAVNALGVDLLSKSSPAQANALISPYSIQSVMVMAYAGAAGETQTQMAATLHYPGEEIVSDFAALRTSIASLGGEDSQITLSVADRLFGQEGYPFLPGYLSLLKDQFQAPLEPMDFIGDSRGATQRINTWVKEQTKEKIDRIVPDGALNEDTRLVLVNAIYLKAPWLFAFQERATQPGVFHKADGTTVDVPMMRHTENLGYLDGDGFVAVSLPYENRDLQFVVLLPDADLAAFEKALTPALLGSVAKLPVKNVNLRLPKFRIEPALLALGDTLKALGMPSAFNVPIGSADFSGIAPRKPDDYLYISDVFHKTFLEIDEKGTEAAAATAAVMMRATSAPLDPVTVTVDRPFFFAVQQRSTGACLFLGRVMDPTAK